MYTFFLKSIPCNTAHTKEDKTDQVLHFRCNPTERRKTLCSWHKQKNSCTHYTKINWMAIIRQQK